MELKGYKEFISTKEQESYKVVSGVVLVFIAEIDDEGEHGRKFFIDEVNEKEEIIIPSVNGLNMSGERWCLLLSPLNDSEVVIQHTENMDKICSEYGKRLGMDVYSREELIDEIIESIERKRFSEEVRIFKNKQEEKNAADTLFSGIYNFFYRKKVVGGTANSPSILYNAVKVLCEKNNIPLVSYEKLVENCGRTFKLSDISRMSGFIVREVYLQEGWYKNDSGAIIAYKMEEGDECVPVACFREKNKYWEFNPNQNKCDCINDQTHDSYIKNAYMLYRPLPKEKITLCKLIMFALRSLKIRDVISILAVSFLVMVIQMTIPFLYQALYDKYIPMGSRSAVINVGLFALAIGISNVFFTLYKGFLQFKTTVCMEFELQNAVYHRLFNLKESIYEKIECADLVRRATSITKIVKQISYSITSSVIPLVLCFVYIFFMGRCSWEYTRIGLLYLMVGFIATVLIGLRQVKYSNELIELGTESSSFLFQLLKGIEKIRIAGRENIAVLNYCSRYIELRNLSKKKFQCRNLSNCVKDILTSLFVVVIYWKASVSKDMIQIGTLISFLSIYSIFSNSIFQVCEEVVNVGNLYPEIKKNEIFFVGIKESTLGGNVGKVTGNIEVNNVCFSYDESENYVLNNVSMKIRKGEYVGIVGASGSGKSTLLRLLLGFNEAQSGKIYYDNKDIDDLDKSELRRKLGVVLQNGELIAGSIYENIAISSSETTSDEVKKECEKVEEVVRKVGLEEDIMNMPMGLQTIISEGASAISGGQKQRILIARAIFNNPKILLFDEATSALDNISQRVVCENLEKLDATRIVIAHRLSTVKSCDRIFVMDKGEIIESGSYEDLMAKCGVFYNLVKRQIA